MTDKRINVYIPNLPHRTERKESILKEFSDKGVYRITMVVPENHPVPSASLWKTFVKIVAEEDKSGSEYFIFCEDDHIFTSDYSEPLMLENIRQAQELGADLLSGGFSWYDMPIQISNHLFWVKDFTGMQFTVVYRKFYRTILDSDIHGNHTLDLYLSTLSDDILVMSPYISVQKEFGYSDVTSKNNVGGFVSNYFKKRNQTLNLLRKVKEKLSYL